MPKATRKVVRTRPLWFAPLLAAIRVLSDPANLAMLPAMLASLLIVAADASLRLALVLAITAVLLSLTRLRHAITVSALLLAGFAVAALLHVAAITVPVPLPSSHHGA